MGQAIALVVGAVVVLLVCSLFLYVTLVRDALWEVEGGEESSEGWAAGYEAEGEPPQDRSGQ